jgi:methylmalonyl-CoA/ethylmalonyl-CoA epimerase
VVVTGIHHVGCATKDATELADRFTELFDVPIAHQERFEGMQVVFLDTGGGFLELLEPTTDDGPIHRYLDEHDAGIHHVALSTPDIDAAIDRARDLDVEPIDEEPRAGAWGHDVVFLHPRDTGGMLVEFVVTD